MRRGAWVGRLSISKDSWKPPRRSDPHCHQRGRASAKSQRFISSANASRLTGVAYHYGVRLEVPHPATAYCDNCFDLMAGEVRTLIASNAQVAISPGDLSIRTLLRHI